MFQSFDLLIFSFSCFDWVKGVLCEPEGGRIPDASLAIKCPSFFDSLFESAEQINFEKQFQNSDTDSSLVSFINSFCPKSDDEE